MCQPHAPAPCAIIKANSRLRRAPQRKDRSNETDAQGATAVGPATNRPNAPKKKTRRKRRPTKKQQLWYERHLAESCDASTSTASTASTTGESPSELSSHAADARKSSDKSPSSTRRRRSKKSRNSRINKVVNVAPANLSEEEKECYVALDCEMVGIGPGGCESRLARVCLMHWDGEIIYDRHVKVEERVTDYRTFVSGITAEDLSSDDAVTFDDAQSTVARLLQDRILVGHGLRNDLQVLALSHPWYDIRDTAKYEPFMRPAEPHDINPLNASHLPKKLRVLARDKLGMVIQEEGMPHCPADDALAALELYKKHRVKWEKAMNWKAERTRALVTAL